MSSQSVRRRIRPDWFDADSAIIPAHHQSALLIELIQNRGYSDHRLLRHTGLFVEDIHRRQAWITPRQFLKLVGNARQLDTSQELGFVWGSRWFPGHYGAASTLLYEAGSLAEILATLKRYQLLLSPLLTLDIIEDDRWCYLVWLDGIGTGSQRSFLIETTMSAVSSLSAWLAGEKLPWKYALRSRESKQRAPYDVYFGPHLRFSQAVDAMIIEKSWLHQRWRTGSDIVTTVARGEADAELQRLGPTHGFVGVVYRHLFRNCHHPMNLPQVAEHFGMSSPTLKRKLKHHNTGFQALFDEARLHTSLYLFHIQKWNVEQVAEHLNCRDSTNFRRLFKRWTGMTPSQFNADLTHLQ